MLIGGRQGSGLACVVLLSLSVSSGCFEDVEADGISDSGGAATSGNDTGNADDGDDADTSVGCQGCLDAAGGCLAGNVDAACGVLADACVVCEQDNVCAEGECIPRPACEPASCDGCCDGDTCVAGDVTSACGSNGSQCATCPPGGSCSSGSCQLPCEDRCDGCCTASDECIEPAAVSTEQCGEQGESCFGCDEDSECIDGTCISSACLAECDGCCDGDTCLGGLEAQACGQDGSACESCVPGTMCDGTGCAPDPASLWDLVVLNATVAPTNASMADWDAFGGLPDPYVRITIDGDTQETAEVENTLLPAWNETIFDGLTVESLQDSWSVSMVDSDAVFDEVMQTCTTTIPPYGFGYALTASCGDGDYVYWTLTIATVLSSD